MSTTKRLRKHEIDNVLENGVSVLTGLYARARSHIDMAFTDDELIAALVPYNDIPMVRRSLEVFDYAKDSLYIDYPDLEVDDFPGVPDNLRVRFSFKTKLGFMVPGYLARVNSTTALPPSFDLTFAPVVAQLVELRQMQRAAVKAWFKTELLCGKNLARMKTVWPAIATIGQQLNIDLSSLPRPQGCPAADPELRELITIGTTFINSVLLMPPMQRSDRGYELDVFAKE